MEAESDFIKEKIEELRKKLLDLSNRNSLINFRHSEKALTHIRVIDELPDFLFGSLIEGNGLTFKPLPEPDDEPHDEQTEEFQTYFREATLTDEQYLKEVVDLEDKDDCFDTLAVIERNLKNRVREKLGMPPVHELKPLSNAKWAKQNRLEPKYDMPEPSNSDYEKSGKHYDEYIQTLFKPKELQHKLSGLRRYINADINETGVNTFYAAFGYLERYDSDSSDKALFAPLVLLQLDPPIETKTHDGEVYYSIKASGEDPQYNLPLAEKLKEFGLYLPELSEDDTPESYMQKVERLIKNQKRWRVRRFITFGRFQFSRLVMYHDLNPDHWPDKNRIEKNSIITSLIAGEKVSSDNSSPADDDATIYDIDTDPQVEEAAPILIMEADSSQHSAIVDALKGNNLVIKGPPGTGKSQTITNLIANALAKGKKILFVAEKMAALNVVYSRLQNAGLGDYCLELHSTKAKLKDIKESLATTIENRKSVKRPCDLKKRVDEIKEVQYRLREYSDILNHPFGDSGKTIHDMMWAEQHRRNAVEGMPVSIKKIQIADVTSYSDQKLENLCNELQQLETLEAESKKHGDRHPWAGVHVTKASSLKAQEVVQAFEECKGCLETVLLQIDRFKQEFQWTAKRTLQEWRDAAYECQKIKDFKNFEINFDLLRRVKTKPALTTAEILLETLTKYDQAFNNIAEWVKSPSNLLESKEQVESLCGQAKNLHIFEATVEELSQQIEIKQKQIKQWKNAVASFEKIKTKVLRTSDDLTIEDFELLTKAVSFLSRVDRDLLFLRQETVLNEANKPILENGLQQQKDLLEQAGELQSKLDLNFDVSDADLNEAVYELSTANVMSVFKPKYHKAWKTYKSVQLAPEKITAQDAANILRRLKSHKEHYTAFKSDIRFQQVAGTAFNGFETDFVGLREINSWAIDVKREFSGLEEKKDSIKYFLLKTDVSDLEAIKDETADIDTDLLVKSITEDKDKNLSDVIEILETDLNSKLTLRDYLNSFDNNENLTYAQLSKLLDDDVKVAACCLERLEDDKELFKNSSGDFYTGTDTDRIALKETITLSRPLETLELSDDLDNTKYSPKLFTFVDDLSVLLQTLLLALDKFEKSYKTLEDVSNLNLVEYIDELTIQEVSLEKFSEAIQLSLDNQDALKTQMSLKAFLENAKSQPYAKLLETLNAEGFNYQKSSIIFEYLYYKTVCRKAFGKHDLLDNYRPHWLNGLREGFKELDRQIIKLNCQELAYKLAQTQPPEGTSRGRVSEYTDMGLIRHQALKEKTRAIPVRKLLSQAGHALQTLKPCFLMSPLSVAQYISPHGIKFDMVVIDEASQMRPEDALGAIGRSGQIVVVGDPKQLPPTSFFSKQAFSDNDYDEEDKIDNESILDLALGRFRPTRDLQWHYRSRHESLIAFSNSQFYDGRLIIFPSPEGRNKNFGVQYNYVGGVYNASCNVKEAQAVAEAARKFMRDHPDKSLGIATMNSLQRDLIYEEMYRLFLNDETAEAYRQKWEDTLEPFFVKNLESVQGDERDAIFISTVYGPAVEGGTVAQRFGPINGKFGHRRLNVLFTRAKHNLVLFTSLRPDDITVTETSALGLKAFKGFLEYASDGKLDAGRNTGKEPDSDFEICVKERLESIGCEVIPQVGVAGYFIDLGVKHPDYPYGFLIGVECDGAMYHSSKSARDRDRIRQEVLEGLGWEIYRIWSTDWFHDTNGEFDKLKSHIQTLITHRLEERNKQEENRIKSVMKLQENAGSISRNAEISTNDNFIQSKKEDTEKAVPACGNKVVELYDTVSFRFLEDKEQPVRTATIVASQSDVNTGNINQFSAIGRVLVGSEIHEELEVNLPIGSRTIQIIDIQKNAIS